MKKTITILTASVLFITLLTLGSCKKDDNGNNVNSCTELANAASTAAMNFSSNPNKENCQTYKTAITNYIDGCAIIEQAVKDQYLTELESLDCEGL